MILIPAKMSDVSDDVDAAKEGIRRHKALVLVPSYSRAAKWNDLVKAPKERATEAIEEFKLAKGSEKLILTARYDGVDLPGDMCRVVMRPETMHSTTLDLVKSALKLDGTVRPSQRAGILRFLATMDYSLALPAAIAAPDKFLAPKEAARYLGLSKRTLARYIKVGKIKPSRLNARVLRFKKADLDTFIAGDNTTPTPDPAILRPTG